MGKRYYCDYCERSFADGAENRKKHLASVHHQKLRKSHYDMFKDASKILEENKFKKPCRKFHSSGHCAFGTGCKYSHLTPSDVQNLQHQDASKILEENKLKKPCRKFHSSGHCAFGAGCKYSHLIPLDVQNLQYQASLEKTDAVLQKPLPNPNIDAWLQSKVLKMDKTSESTSTSKQTVLPSILSTIPNLPPSLIPSRPSKLLTSGENSTQQWG